MGTILLSLALIVALSASLNRCKTFGYSKKKAIILTLLTCAYSCAGVKLLYILENIGKPIVFGLSGVSFYGAMFFLPIGLLITSLVTKDKFLDYMDFLGPYNISTLGIMRIGCYISGCCSAHKIILMNRQLVPPIQLIEATLDIGLFFFLILYEKYANDKTKGLQYPRMLIAYSFIRMVMECFREAPVNFCGLTNGQWFSIIAFVAGCIMTVIIRNLKTTKSETQKKK